jgi:CMP-N-acetylneuraminic acid synthetase
MKQELSKAISHIFSWMIDNNTKIIKIDGTNPILMGLSIMDAIEALFFLSKNGIMSIKYCPMNSKGEMLDQYFDTPMEVRDNTTEEGIMQVYVLN